MQDTARRLQEAANAMKRSGTGASGGSAGEAAAALERLRDAQRGLEGTRADRLEQGVQDAMRKAQGLKRAQEKIAAEAEEQVAAVNESDAGLGRLLERKDGLASEISGLEGELDRMARDARRGKKDAARKLQEAADAIRDTKLRDKIRYSKAVVSAGRAEQSRQLEGEIGSDLEALERKLQEAAGAAGPSDGDKRAAGLERMRDLVRRMESLEDRLGDGSSPGGAPAAGAPGPLTPGQARQLRRELRERSREADALGRELGGAGARGNLGEVVRAMRGFEGEGIYGDPRGLAQLVSSVIEGLKSAEFALRRDIEGPDRERLSQSGTQDLPPGWQRLVEEYYRALSKKPANDR
jgi:hypothetical protein